MDEYINYESRKIDPEGTFSDIMRDLSFEVKVEPEYFYSEETESKFAPDDLALDSQELNLKECIKEKCGINVAHENGTHELCLGNVCKKTFQLKALPKCHEETHPSERVASTSSNEHERSFSYESFSLTDIPSIKSRKKTCECDQCGKSFPSKADLAIHTRVHTGEKLFSCNECGKSFSQKSNFKRHLKIHSTEKLYFCNECKKSFLLKECLVKHMRIHTGEKPFRCGECGRSFSQKCDLNKHIKIHTGERAFLCDKCGKSFTRKGHLTQHVSNRHMENKVGKKNRLTKNR